jgi:hypothetical protein
VFEGVRARIERLLREHSRSDPRAYAAGVREAVLEAKVGVSAMRDALVATRRELEAERKHLADAERRGRLATEVPDPETVALAARYAERHRTRVAVLERKLVVQQEELSLAEREVAEMIAEYRSARTRPGSDAVEAAWRDLEAAGGERPETAAADDQLRIDTDRKLKDQAVEAQLAFLKNKLKKGDR